MLLGTHMTFDPIVRDLRPYLGVPLKGYGEYGADASQASNAEREVVLFTRIASPRRVRGGVIRRSTWWTADQDAFPPAPSQGRHGLSITDLR